MLRRIMMILTIAAALWGCTGCSALQGETAKAAEKAEIQQTGVTVEELRTLQFPDVPEMAVFRDAVSYAAWKGCLGGKEDGTFQPDGLTTRAHVVTALYRLEQANGTVKELKEGKLKKALKGFSDVEPDSWYAQAVAWSAESGLSRGFEDGTFRPDQLVNRQQLASLMRRYCQFQGLSTEVQGTLPDYWDGPAGEDVAWALENGLLPEVTRSIRPTFAVNRAQLAQALTAADALITGEPAAADIAARQHQEVTAPSVHQEIQAAVDAAAKKYGAMGVQVAVVENGTVSDKFSGGWATRYDDSASYEDAAGPEAKALGDPMTADHKMRVASLSKVVVGMSAMALQQQGIVDLDTSIGTYWDGVPARNPEHPNDPVTIRTLMTHTSSLAMLESTSATGEAVMNRLATGKGFSGGIPGDIGYWNYNNYAFGVLGLTLERAAGKVMDQITGQYFMEPLQIDGSFESGNIHSKWGLATLYAGRTVTRSTEMQREIVDLEGPGADGKYFAGGFTTSAVDLAKLVAVLANDGSFEGRRVLWPGSVQAMETPFGTVSTGYPFEQCLVLRRQENLYGRPSLYYHTGSAYGVYNFLSYDPATGDGLVVLTTGASARKDDRDIYAICGEISKAVYAALDAGRAADTGAGQETDWVTVDPS